MRVAHLVLLLVVSMACRSAAPPLEKLPDQTVDGVLCHVRQFRSKVDGRIVYRYDTVEPIATADGMIPAGSLMRRPGFPAPDSLSGLRAFVLHRNATFGNVTCRGFFEFDTYFDENWRLRVCPLKGDHVIDGVPCLGTSVSVWREARQRSGTHPSAVFYADGKLQK